MHVNRINVKEAQRVIIAYSMYSNILSLTTSNYSFSNIYYPNREEKS